MLASIVEEVEELAREINDLEGYKKKKTPEKKKNLGLELADIIFSIICIANYYKIDLEKIFRKVIEKYTERDACMHALLACLKNFRKTKITSSQIRVDMRCKEITLAC